MQNISPDGPSIGTSLPSPGKFVLVNSKDDVQLLRRILLHPGFPHNADVFTHELSLTGARVFPLKRKSEIEHRELRQAARVGELLQPFLGIAKEKRLRIWIGHVLREGRALYNAYSLIDADGVRFTHRKKFLWKTEKWLYDEPECWNGNFDNCSLLICSEISAYFDPLRWDRPSKIIDELRNAAPKIVAVPSHWWFCRDSLLQNARTLAGPKTDKRYPRALVRKGIRDDGAMVFIVNSFECAVLGPVPHPTPSRKTTVYAFSNNPGWIDIATNHINTMHVK